MEHKNKRWVVYVRISRDDTQEHGSESQEATIQRYADKCGIKLLEWYKDNEGYNPRGDGLDRPELQRMYADAQKKEFDCVLCAYQTRLGLLGRWLRYWISLFDIESVSFWDSKGNNLSTNDSATIERTTRVTLKDLEWLDEHAQKQLNERIRAGDIGDYRGGNVPYYCDVVCWDKDLTRKKYRIVYNSRLKKTQYIYNTKNTTEEEVIDEREFIATEILTEVIDKDGIKRIKRTTKNSHPRKDSGSGDRMRLAPTRIKERIDTIQKMFEWYSQEECISFQEIANRLNRMRIPTIFSNYWTAIAVRQLLTNEAVIGKPTSCKTSRSKYAKIGEYRTADKRSEPIIANKGVHFPTERIHPDKWVRPMERVFDPIVPEDVFWKVQNKIKDRVQGQGTKKPSRDPSAWLRGFVYCVHCGLPMSFHNRKQKSTGNTFKYVPFYRCSAYQNRGRRTNPFKCNVNFVRAAELEGYVEDYLVSTQQKMPMPSRGNVILESIMNLPIDTLPPEEKQRLSNEIEELKIAGKKLWAKMKIANCPIAEQEAGQDMQENAKQIAEKENQLKQLNERMTSEEKEKRLADAITAHREGTFRAKKEALSKVLERIDCYFEYMPNAFKKHQLKKVKFIPVPLAYHHSDSELNKATDIIQEGLIAMDKEKDGVKIEYKPHFTYEGQICLNLGGQVAPPLAPASGKSNGITTA